MFTPGMIKLQQVDGIFFFLTLRKKEKKPT